MILGFIESSLVIKNEKRANLSIDPLLTNPLNSSTKLQICVTLQNKFLTLCITSFIT